MRGDPHVRERPAGLVSAVVDGSRVPGERAVRVEGRVVADVCEGVGARAHADPLHRRGAVGQAPERQHAAGGHAHECAGLQRHDVVADGDLTRALEHEVDLFDAGVRVPERRFSARFGGIDRDAHVRGAELALDELLAGPRVDGADLGDVVSAHPLTLSDARTGRLREGDTV